MKVLLVDDAPDILYTFRAMLKRLSCVTDVAENGEQAWEMIQKTRYDIVISDWFMPILNGVDLCKKIRKSNFDRYIYFILLTASECESDLMIALEAGADDFIRKPCKFPQLKVHFKAAQRIIELEESLLEKTNELETAYEVVQQDLRSAAHVQQSLLPATKEIPGAKTDWIFNPAEHIGGDSLNYYPIDQDKTFFYMIDVSGHGASSALVSVSLHTMFNIYLHDYSAGLKHDVNISSILLELVAKVNSKLLNDTFINSYFTMICGVIDRNQQTLQYIQAGHPFPIFYKAQQQKAHLLEENGFPVGLLETAEYEVKTIKYEIGDRFVIFSDGVIEMPHIIGQNYYEWITKAVEHIGSMDLALAKDYIEFKITSFLKEGKQDDDISLLILEFK